MDSNQKKAGRPKAPPRTGPLVLAEGQARTKVTFEISERAAEELAEYAHWVAKCSAIAPNQAKFKTVDFALREIFRRDRVWQAERRAPSDPSKIAAAAPPPAPRPAALAAPSPSPPAPREPRAI